MPSARQGAIAFISAGDDPEAWRQALQARLGRFEWRVFPDLGQADEIDVVLAWKPPPGAWAKFGKLKLIVSLGMGVDHLFVHGPTPQGVPIVRINDPRLIEQMGDYVLLNVLRIHRQDAEYEALQRKGEWRQLPPKMAHQRRIGIMGMGEIGTVVAARLAALGFDVAGWSRTARKNTAAKSYAGTQQLPEFLVRCDILVNVLALTDATRGIVNARTLALLPRGSHFINIARGGHVVDADLLAALDSGQLASATLDVFNQEPLPTDHLYWRHPKVRVTPHVAGPTFAESSAPGVAENIKRARAGRDLTDRIDPARGY